MNRPGQAAVPFLLRRSHDVVSGPEVTSTVEDSHGLLHIEGGQLKAQWSTTREVTRAGREVRTDRDLGAVREVSVPLAGIAGAEVKSRWFPWPRYQLVIRASDLRAFAVLAGEAGLLLEHPAELVLGLRRADRAVASEFVADLEMALSEIALLDAESDQTLPPSDVRKALP